MALPIKTKTTIDLQVSEGAKRVCALNFATDIAVASIAQGNTFLDAEVTALADTLLEWLQRNGAATPQDEQGDG